MLPELRRNPQLQIRLKRIAAAVARWQILVAVILGTLACQKKREIDVPIDLLGSAYVLSSALPGEQDLDHALQALRETPQDPFRLREAGTLYQRLSPPDRWDYVDAAIDLLEKADLQLPNDPQTLIYLGLAKAAKARGPATSLFAKLPLAKEGFRLMDRAVAFFPESFSLRLLRAKAQLLAPAIVGRTRTLNEDRAWLEEQLDGGERLPPHLMVMGFVFLGDYAHRAENDEPGARKWWSKAAQLGAGTPFGEQARQRLTGGSSEF